MRLKGLEPARISAREPKSRMSTNSITGAFKNPIAYAIGQWSGQRGSNSLPPPWQGGALPDELCPQMVPPVGVEPTTRGFSVRCSTN